LDRGSKRGLLSHFQRRVSGEPTGLRVKAHAWAWLPNGCGLDPCARSAFWLGMQSAQSAKTLDEAQSGRATSGGLIFLAQFWIGHFDKCGCVAASGPLSNLGCP
jgi:hypothetical protein